MSGLEGFARTAPLFAAWLYSGRRQEIIDEQTGKSYDIVTILQQGLLAGTDPSSPDYWGDIHDDDQRIVEAADIARVLWLTRDRIWFRLVEAFLKNVGYLEEFDRRNFDEFKINYLQNGWFRDGQNDHVDYYNAWGISYDIYWIHLFDPFFDHEFVKRVLTDSGALTAHLISPGP
jgi:hypothetical protein